MSEHFAQVLSIITNGQKLLSEKTSEALAAEIVEYIENSRDDEPPTLDEIAIAALPGVLAGDGGNNVQAAAESVWLEVMPAYLRGRKKFLENPNVYLAGAT